MSIQNERKIGLIYVLLIAIAAGFVDYAKASDPIWETLPENGRQVHALSDGARIWAGKYVRFYHNPKGAPDVDTQLLIDYMIWAWTERTDLRIEYMGETDQTVIDGAIVLQWQTLLGMWAERGSLSVVGYTNSRFYASTGVIVSARLVLRSDDYKNGLWAARKGIHTAIHELGHAIGINTHSQHEHDVMYYSRSGADGRYALTAADVSMTRYQPDVCYAELTPHGDVYVPAINGAGATLTVDSGRFLLTHEHHSGQDCSGTFDGDTLTAFEVRSMDGTLRNATIARDGDGWVVVGWD